MNIKTIYDLKREFRKWYGAISVEELVTNFELIELIKRIERYFVELGIDGGASDECYAS